MNPKDPVKVCRKSPSDDTQENRDWTKTRLDHINRKLLLSNVCLFLSCHIFHMNIMAPRSKLCSCMNEVSLSPTLKRCKYWLRHCPSHTKYHKIEGPKICSNWAMKQQMIYRLAILLLIQYHSTIIFFLCLSLSTKKATLQGAFTWQ